MNRPLCRLAVVALAAAGGVGVAPSTRAQTPPPPTISDAESNKVREILALAQEAVGRITDPKERLGSYALLAKHQAIGGDVTGALATAQKIGKQPDAALLSIAQAQAVRGDLAGAEKTAARIKDDLAYSQAMATVAMSKARARDFDGAYQTLEKKIKAYDILEMLMLYQGVVRMQIRAGDLEDAARRLNKVPDTSLLALLSATAAKAGDAKSAARHLSDARKVKGGVFSMEGPSGIAEGLLEGGDTAGALRELEPVVASMLGQTILPRIIQALTARRDFVGARQNAARIEDRPDRAVALAQIARAQAEAGDRTGALETLRQADMLVADVKSVQHRVEALGEIAVARHRLGEADAAAKGLEEASRTLTQASRSGQGFDAYLLSESGKQLVGAWADTGDDAGALATARQLPSRGDGGFFPRRDALLLIAQRQRRAGKRDHAANTFEAAFAEARAAGGAGNIRARLEACLSRSKAGDVEGALAWAKAETRPLERTLLLLACSEGILDRDGTYSRTEPTYGLDPSKETP